MSSPGLSLSTPTFIIPRRGEFVDALAALCRGNGIVCLDEHGGACVLDGVRLLWSFPSLLAFGLVAEYDNRHGFACTRYFRMTAAGREFALDALAAWRARPLLERLAIRLLD